MKRNINFTCDFCKTPKLTPQYEPINTRRGMKVCICPACGLMQSFSTVDYESRPKGSMSADADRSSYRYTKDIVAEDYLKIIKEHIDFNKVDRFLDIGSNRGCFIKWIQTNYPNIKSTGVESDPSIVGTYENRSNIEVQACRFENAEIAKNSYDFAHCIHTLEHAVSATEMLRGIRDALKVNGLFFLAVPNAIFFDDIIEELFIDPHTYHFTYQLLLEFVKQNGFTVEYASQENYKDIIFVLRKNASIPKDSNFKLIDKESAAKTLHSLQHYQHNIINNRNALTHSCMEIIAASKTHKIVIWGAGRIFDALMQFGQLDLKHIYKVVDTHLSNYVTELYGKPLTHPKKLCEENPDEILIYIASRNYAKEIQQEAESLGLQNFIHFSPPS